MCQNAEHALMLNAYLVARKTTGAVATLTVLYA